MDNITHFTVSESLVEPLVEIPKDIGVDGDKKLLGIGGSFIDSCIYHNEDNGINKTKSKNDLTYEDVIALENEIKKDNEQFTSEDEKNTIQRLSDAREEHFKNLGEIPEEPLESLMPRNVLIAEQLPETDILKELAEEGKIEIIKDQKDNLNCKSLHGFHEIIFNAHMQKKSLPPEFYIDNQEYSSGTPELSLIAALTTQVIMLHKNAEFFTSMWRDKKTLKKRLEMLKSHANKGV